MTVVVIKRAILQSRADYTKMEQELVTLNGTIESIVYRNENNGWTVFELACDDELFTVVGTVFQIVVGEELRAVGEWVNHPSYGRQLRALNFERQLPATTAAILKYLSSGAIKGIGPVSYTHLTLPTIYSV